MREILFDRFGGPDVLTLHTDSPRPEPAEGEVLVEVSYAGLNPLDFKIRDGSSGMAEGLPLPAGTGREMTGTVLGAGADLDLAELASRGLAPGTRVFGMPVRRIVAESPPRSSRSRRTISPRSPTILGPLALGESRPGGLTHADGRTRPVEEPAC